ncbi:MAG: hypothetical protein NZM41_04415 [Saprospiraceae bacterium]|nr:hypothetical protein [Saprospiraceae bacterium]
MQLLTPDELEDLEKFVASPIFNEANRFHDTVRLFEYLRAHYPHFSAPELDKSVAGQALFPTRNQPENELERTMAQLMRIVKQFINFRYSAVRGGRAVRSGRKQNVLQGPVSLLNFARQQLALMRFYSERLLQKPADFPRDIVSDPKTEGKKRRVKRAENFFRHLYDELKEALDTPKRFDDFEEYEFNDFYYFRYLAEQEKAIYESLHEWSAQGGFVNLLTATESLDRFYLLSKLDQMCRLLHLQQIAMPFAEDSSEYRRLMMNQTLTAKMVKLLIKHGYHEEDPSTELYFTLLQMLVKKKPEKTDLLAERFFQLLRQHADLVPVQRFRDFNVMVRSYWARRYRQTRERRFLEQIFLSHQEDLEQMRRNSEDIQSSHFQSILFNAIKLGHLDWAEAFLREFAPRITATPEPQLVADIGYAMLAFARGQYQQAAQHLPHYFLYGATDDPTLYSLAATLDVRIRYELGILFDEESTNMRRATHKRIKENKTLRPERRASILGFYNAAVQLFRQKEKLALRAATPEQIRREVERVWNDLDVNPVVDSEWLREKCRELLAKLPAQPTKGQPT